MQSGPCTHPLLESLHGLLLEKKGGTHLLAIQGPSGCASVSSSLPPALGTNITAFPTRRFFPFLQGDWQFFPLRSETEFSTPCILVGRVMVWGQKDISKYEASKGLKKSTACPLCGLLCRHAHKAQLDSLRRRPTCKGTPPEHETCR